MSLCGGRAMPAGERERRASERTLRSSQNRPIAVSAGDRGGQTVRSKIMFELGSTLREARVRRGIELAQVAAETRIRTRYLQALEDERFELLPGSAYAKGFLRAYSDYLGLDGQLFVDEYNARCDANGTPPAPHQLELRPGPLRRYGVGTNPGARRARCKFCAKRRRSRTRPRCPRRRAIRTRPTIRPAPRRPWCPDGESGRLRSRWRARGW